MKYQGQQINPLVTANLVIPKGDTKYLFKIKSVNVGEDFEKLCPKPTAPKRSFPNGKTVENVNDPKYQEAINAWLHKRMSYMILLSISDSEITFDTVDMSNSDTWNNYETELTEAGFSNIEQITLFNKVLEVNGMSQEAIDKATEDFLSGQAQLE